MSALPTNPNPAGAQAAPVEANVDEWVKDIWQKNRNVIVGGFSLVVLLIAGWGGWNYFSAQREQGIEQEYAAATTADQYQAFIQAHPDHPLAGMAALRIADSAYSSGSYADAVADYQRAGTLLQPGIFASRARLGLAVSQIQSGQTADGTASLHLLADDPKQSGALRTEALYHLASVAAEAGRAEELRQLAVQAVQADAQSPWTQRIFSLQPAQLPAASAAAAPASGASAPAVSLPVLK